MKGDCALPLKEKRMWLLHDAVAQLIFYSNQCVKVEKLYAKFIPSGKNVTVLDPKQN